MLRFLLLTSCLTVISLTGVCKSAELVALFEMEDNVLDSIGLHTASVVGNVSFVTGKFGKAANFDGTGDAIIVADTYGRLQWVAPRTICAWVLPMPGLKSFATISSLGGTGSWRLQRYGSQEAFDFQVSGTDPFGIYVAGACPLSIGVWQHIAVVEDGFVRTAYVNGIVSRSVPYTGTCNQAPGSPIYIGASATAGREWKGYIDDVAVINGALSAEQIRRVLNYGAKIAVQQASDPSPAVGGSADAPVASLNWNLPDPNNNCDVFISANSDMSTPTQLVNNANVLSVSTAAFGILSDFQNYYWCVDSYDPNGIKTLGEVWRFRTTTPKATNPAPNLGATINNIYNDTLRWEAGRGAEQRRIYISTVESDITNRTAPFVTSTDPNSSFNPSGPRNFDTTYYWAVDEISNGGTTVTPGNTWNFRTEKTATINNLDYADLEAALAVWSGTPTQPGFDSKGWLILQYGAQTNMYSRTFPTYDGAVLDLSDTAYIRIRYSNGAAECSAPFPVVKFKLRNAADAVLFESTLQRVEGEASATLYDWIVPVAGLGLSNVHKMEFEVGPYTGCSSGMWIDYIVAAGAGACEQALIASSGDVNKDCIVNLSDLALVAGDWLNCTWVPETLCP